VLWHFDNFALYGENSSSELNPQTNASDYGYPFNDWAGGGNVFENDGTYATTTTVGEALDVSNFSLSVSEGEIIKGIEVILDYNPLTACEIGDPLEGENVTVDLSWDNGTTYSNGITVFLDCGVVSSDKTASYGNSTHLWGRDWLPSEFSNSSFRVRMNFTTDAGLGPNIDRVSVIPYTGGLVYDFSNNNTNNATLQNGPVHNFSGGKFAGAYEFDGVDDYIYLNSTAEINEYPFTLSAWAKKIDDGNNGTIVALTQIGVSDFRMYGLWINSSGQAEMIADDTSGSGGAILGGGNDITGGWHHIVGVFTSDSDKRLYVDGDNVVNITTSETFLTISNIEVGRLGDSTPSDYFNGTIDEVVVWNRSLSSTEIKDLYKLKEAFYYWKVNLTDWAGNH